MSERIKVSKIKDHIWLLNDNNEATGYVVVGKEKALIIDTMIVRRHIVGGINRTLISVKLPSQSCRTGTRRRLSAA